MLSIAAAGYWVWQRSSASPLPAIWATPSSLSPPILFSSSSARRLIGDANPIYLVHDGRLGSQGTADWRQSYTSWQMVGGWIEVPWEKVNPSPGHYDFSPLFQYIEAASRIGEGRPVAISILLHGEEETASQRLADWTPAWVYEEIGGRPVVGGRPVGYHLQPEGCDRPAALPQYDHPLWQQRVDELIAALAREFDTPDRYANLQAIHVAWGFEGLDEPTGDRVCPYSAQLDASLRQAFDTWTEHVIAKLAEQFRHRLVWVMTQPQHAERWARQLEQKADGRLGLLIVQPAADVPLPSPENLRASTASFPIGWRLAEPNALAQTYWWLLAAAAYKVDWLDVQWAHVVTVETIQQHTGLNMLSFARDYMSHSLEDAPGQWVLFGPPAAGVVEDFFAPATVWSVALRPNLARHDQLGSVPNDMPARFGGLLLHMDKGWRSDASRGVHALRLDLYEGWEGKVPIEAGAQPAILRIIYFDHGRDAFGISYPTQGRRIARRTMTKTATGQWLAAEFPIIRPDWSAITQDDVVIDDQNDGDELIHLVEIRLGTPAEGVARTAETAGWELLERTEDQSTLSREGPSAPSRIELEETPMRANLPAAQGVPPVVWFCAAIALGLAILAYRLLTLNRR